VKTATLLRNKRRAAPTPGAVPNDGHLLAANAGLIDYAPRLGEEKPHFAACHWVEQNVGK
jgi:hypothetical protein